MIESLKPVGRASLSDNIIEQILGLISSGVLKPGDRIPTEKQLCKQFRVGRTSVREALRSLSVMGVLTAHAGEGTFVAEDSSRHLEKILQLSLLLNSKVVEDLIETRIMLESQTAYLAAQRAKTPDLEEMAAAIQGMSQSIRQTDLYLGYDLEFHVAIAKASQNSILCQLLSMIRGYLQAWIKQTLSSPVARDSELRARKSITEHETILKALSNGDAEEARRAIREHILSSSADFRHRLPEKSAGSFSV